MDSDQREEISMFESLKKIKVVNCSPMVDNVQSLEISKRYFSNGDWIQCKGVNYVLLHLDKTGTHLTIGTQGVNIPVKDGDNLTLFTNKTV